MEQLKPIGIVTLATDFGLSDAYVGALKGAILKQDQGLTIVDITHQIPAQDVRKGSRILAEACGHYPRGTVHVGVVDPGVGTARRPIAAQIGEHYFVGPDNGVFSKLYQKAEKKGWPIRIFHTNKPEYWWKLESNIFHGRDIFSPIAAHLAAGVPIEELGEEIHDEVRIPVPEATFDETGADGEVVMIYKYLGNMTVNIHRTDLPENFDPTKAKLEIGGRIITGIRETFGEAQSGELIALYGTSGYIIVAVVNDSAYNLLKCEVGDKVRLTY